MKVSQIYSVDDKVVEIANVDQCLDRVLANICHWFKQIRNLHRGLDTKGHRVVLVV